MKHLESFETAAEFIGEDFNAVLQTLEALPEKVKKPQIALYKLSVLSEASWKKGKKHLDWTNRKQWKYYPWFDLSSGSASGFSYYGYGYDVSTSGVGSRLVFPSRSDAEYVGETYKDLYRDLMTLDQ